MAGTDLFQGHIDVALSNLAVRYRNARFIADILFPRVPVDRQADKYFIHRREDLIPETDDVRAATAASKLIKMSLSDDTYFAPDRSLADLIPAEDVPKPNLPTRRERATQTITQKLLLNHEIRAATLLTTAANYPAGNKVQLAGNDQWSSTDAASGLWRARAWPWRAS